MKYLKYLVIVTLSVFVAGSYADGRMQQLRQSLATVFPADMVPAQLQASALPGFYEAEIDGRVFYISEDGRYLINGEVLDLQRQVNLTKTRLNHKRRDLLASLDESDMIIYAGAQYRYTVTVFTDVDCGYCRKLHSQIRQYNELGIRVRYLAYPRAGVGSSSYDKAVSVWCADDRNEALTLAESGRPVPQKSCMNPVKDQLSLGKAMGVQGTPAIILDNGHIIPGYVDPSQLLAILQGRG